MQPVETVVKKLKLIGELYSAGDNSYLLLIPDLKAEANINLGTMRYWKPLLDGEKDGGVVNIFKGIVLAEGELKWIGGSVSSGISIYGIIQERNLDRNFEIADWCFRNSENLYLPFGRYYTGKRTFADYREYQHVISEIKNRRAEKHQKLMQRISGRRQVRKTEIQNLRNLSFEERGNIIEELTKKYKNASAIEKLSLIANDGKYPPEYYPKDWIQLNEEEISLIPIEVALKLINKLSTKKKGDWRRFRDILINMCQ